ncbi:MAG: hypothetical protein AABY18_00445 [Candidatus Thermoplasmatota archaeon]
MTNQPRHDQQAEVERLRARRDNARWSAVVGFGLLFGASFSSAFLAGGVAMIAYGATVSMYWSWRLRGLQGDPWAFDPDLDGPQAPEWSRTGNPPAADDADAESDEGRPPST